jgi:hypothetical protein
VRKTYDTCLNTSLPSSWLSSKGKRDSGLRLGAAISGLRSQISSLDINHVHTFWGIVFHEMRYRSTDINAITDKFAVEMHAFFDCTTFICKKKTSH